MAETAKYCEACAGSISPTDRDPRKKEYFNASLFKPISDALTNGIQTEDGTCENCGKSAVVSFYYL